MKLITRMNNSVIKAQVTVYSYLYLKKTTCEISSSPDPDTDLTWQQTGFISDVRTTFDSWSILEQVPFVDAVIVSVGTGGLAAAVGAVIKHIKPNCLVYVSYNLYLQRFASDGFFMGRAFTFERLWQDVQQLVDGDSFLGESQPLRSRLIRVDATSDHNILEILFQQHLNTIT